MKLENILLKDISPGPKHLAKVVGPYYNYLAMSIKDRGVLIPILVRNIAGGYEVIKGSQRYQAALDANHVYIPAQIIDATDAEVEEIQVITSVHAVETKPMAYGQALHRLIGLEPSITLRSMAKKLKIDMEWIRDILGLGHRLSKPATTLMNGDKITLGNAWILAKLPDAQQLNFLKQAQDMKFDEFYELIRAEDRRIRDERRAKYRGKPETKTCVAHIRREFYLDGEHDGGETEFIYTDNPLAESIKSCQTIEEARIILQEPAKIGYYWQVTQIQLKDRVIV